MKIRRINLIDTSIVFYILCVVAANDGSVLIKMARLVLWGVFFLNWLKKGRVKITGHVVWLFSFWILATLSILWAQSTEWAWNMSKTLLVNLLCMGALANLIDKKQERIELSLKTIIAAPLLLELRVIFMGGIFAFLNTREVGGISGNTVGLCGAFAACFAYYFWHQQKPNGGGYLLLFLLNVGIVVLSASRKGLLFIGIPLAVVYVFNRRESIAAHFVKFGAALLGAILCLVAVLKVPFLYNLIGYRIVGLFALLAGNIAAADGSSDSRMQLIQWGMEWFQEKPWLGFGIDNYRVVLVSHHPSWPISYYAHNNYVELLVDVGIVGTLLYYSLYLGMILKLYRYKRYWDNSIVLNVGILIALLVGDMALVSYYGKYIQVLLLIIWIITDNFVCNCKRNRGWSQNGEK